MMIGIRLFLGVLLTFLLAVNARADRIDSRALTIDDIPPCGIQCIFLTVPKTDCSFDDIECQCRSKQLAQDTSACLLANCTMQDSLGTSKVQASLCDYPNESKTKEVLLYASIVYAIAVVFVTLRVTAKIMTRHVTPDDWVIAVAMLLATIPIAAVIAMTKTGFGKHLWNLQPGQLKQSLRLFFIAWTGYNVILGLIKVSLVMLYLQIFISRNFQIVARVFLTYIVLSTIILFFITVFSCSPVNSFWDRDIKGKCLNINSVAYAGSGSSIAQDFIILILPMYSVWKLNTSRYKKLAVGVMFAVGTFGSITTIIRLRSLLTFRISIDPTWDYAAVTIWSELEIASGIVCVCLPSIRILFTMVLPKRLLPTTMSRQSRTTSTPRDKKSSLSQRHSGNKGISWRHTPTMNDSLGASRPGKNQAERGFWPNGNSDDSFIALQSIDIDMKQPRPESQQTLRPEFSLNSPSIRTDGESKKGASVQLHVLSEPEREDDHSSRGSQAEATTALPSVGCLPDGSYSGDSKKNQKHTRPT